MTQRFPTTTAATGYAAAVALAFWPFWLGRSLLNQFSDQKHVYPFRRFAVEYLKDYGDFAPWNPYIFGGMPFAANVTNGDTFYPGMLLRLILPVDVGITLGFLLHIVLAGVFTFLFLRALKLDWGPAFVGGAAYMFTGQIVSLVTAGHDGKLVVSALLPLALLCLHRAITRGDWRWYLGFGGTVALSLLSPHVQLTYYLLMACGFFWLFMVAWSGERPAAHAWWASGGWFAFGLAVGFALDAIQLIPFAEYIGFSPRGSAAATAGGSSTGWAYATAYAMPPEELLNVVWPSFSGMVEQYWGRNPLKFHSEYLGVATVMLATFGFGLPERRRYAWFFVFLTVYAVLFSLGGHTPFYRLPYHLLPGIKMTRGAGMIFFLASLGVASLAAFGTQALMTSAGKAKPRVLVGWLVVLTAAAVLALVGGWKGIMLSFVGPERAPYVEANYATFTGDALRAIGVGVLLTLLVVALRKGRLTPAAWAVALGALVLLDLWSVERRQIRFGPPAEEMFAPDDVVRSLAADGDIYRVLPLAGYVQDNYLMRHGLRSVLGYQGTEIHRFDELMGGKNVWSNAGNPNLWRLLAVKYLVLDRPVEAPQIERVDSAALETYEGNRVYLYRFKEAQPFAWVVRDALKVPDDQVLPALMDPRFDPRRLVLVPPEAESGRESLASLPEAVTNAVTVKQERPGLYRMTLEEPTREAGYLFVSENYYPAWQATVDGVAQPVLRAQLSLMAIPLPAGARSVELVYRSEPYRIGRIVTLATLLLVVGAAVTGGWRGSRRSTGA